MARIRTIKPEFWTSEQVVKCSRDARLLFIGLWNFSDDAGNHPWSPRRIKMTIFPGDDDLDSAAIERLLGELRSVGLILRYEVDAEPYFSISGWQHQRIDRPQDPRFPGPELADPGDSSNDHRMFAERSRRIGKERIGEEGKGKDRKGEERNKGIRASNVTIPESWEDTKELRDAINDWLDHKHSKGQPYKNPKSVAIMLTTFANRYGKASQAKFLLAVPHSIGNNYSGCFAPSDDPKSSNGRQMNGGQKHDPNAKGKVKWQS